MCVTPADNILDRVLQFVRGNGEKSSVFHPVENHFLLTLFTR